MIAITAPTRLVATGLAFVFAWALLSQPLSAQGQRETLETVVSKLASDIAKHLRNNSQKDVLVDSFTAPSNTGANLQIERRLQEALGKETGIKVIDPAELVRPRSWSIRGDYSIRTRPDPVTQKEQSRAQITARLFDDENTQQRVFAPLDIGVEIGDLTDVTLLASATFDASASKDKNDKADGVSQTLAAAIKRPDVSVDSKTGLIRATDASPFAIELLVCDGVNFPPTKADYTPMNDRIQRKEFKLDDGTTGFAIADLRPGEFYAIRIHNNSDRDCAVRLAIDGLSSFEFTDIASYKQTNYWVVEKGKPGTVYGWHRTNDHSDSFEIAHLPDTAIGKSGRSTSRIGMIQAVFFQAWSENETPPAGEFVRGAALDSLGTKQGTEIKTSYVETRRFTSKTPIASIAVRYAKPLDDLPPSIVAN